MHEQDISFDPSLSWADSHQGYPFHGQMEIPGTGTFENPGSLQRNSQIMLGAYLYSMKWIMPFLLGGMILGLLFCSGCSTPSVPITPTPTITPPPTTLPPTPSVTTTTPNPPSLTPEPTVTVPAGFETNIQVYTNDPVRIIIIRYNGGQAQILLQRIDVLVINSKGVIMDSVTKDNNQIATGDLFTIQGAKGVNRVEVSVTINGVKYKIIDQIVLFE